MYNNKSMYTLCSEKHRMENITPKESSKTIINHSTSTRKPRMNGRSFGVKLSKLIKDKEETKRRERRNYNVGNKRAGKHRSHDTNPLLPLARPQNKN